RISFRRGLGILGSGRPLGIHGGIILGGAIIFGGLPSGLIGGLGPLRREFGGLAAHRRLGIRTGDIASCAHGQQGGHRGRHHPSPTTGATALVGGCVVVPLLW